jgi:hypothetical protein
VHIGPASNRVEIPSEGLAGGRECQFLVTYSNGLRGAVAASGVFELAPLGPTATVIRPGDGETKLAGVPLVLEGFVDDPEQPGAARELERLVWTVDERVVGVGPLTAVDGLAPGRHEVGLVYRGEPEARTVVEVSVLEPKELTSDHWTDWVPFELD